LVFIAENLIRFFFFKLKKKRERRRRKIKKIDQENPWHASEQSQSLIKKEEDKLYTN
jgi:uncharacterized membrane protein YciS (DUF1049 family)